MEIFDKAADRIEKLRTDLLFGVEGDEANALADAAKGAVNPFVAQEFLLAIAALQQAQAHMVLAALHARHPK